MLTKKKHIITSDGFPTKYISSMIQNNYNTFFVRTISFSWCM